MNIVGKPKPPEWARTCQCDCDNCCTDPCYSSYHCKHAVVYGELETKAFCVLTGFTPPRSWRSQFDWSRVNTMHDEHGRYWAMRDLEDMYDGRERALGRRGR